MVGGSSGVMGGSDGSSSVVGGSEGSSGVMGGSDGSTGSGGIRPRSQPSCVVVWWTGADLSTPQHDLPVTSLTFSY